MSAGSSELCYLDHAATTPVRTEVAEAMAPFASTHFGNPSGGHRAAAGARRALEEARESVAAVVGCEPGEVVFTAGGTEADNLAVLGTLAAAAELGGPLSVVCSAVEHPAVREPCRAAAKGWFGAGGSPVGLREAPVDGDGVVDLDALEALLDPSVTLVSVMLANNEVGTVQPLTEVAAATHRRAPRAVVHTDAVQAAAWLDLRRAAVGCDLVSVSAHKLGGPKGVGVLVAREGTRLRPLLLGGGQERERRSGTQNVAGAVGLATALRLAAADRTAEWARVAGLRDRLAAGLVAAVPGLSVTVPAERALPGHCHVLVPGVDREELLVLLDADGVCVSAGSSCASGALEPSHVLAAMGLEGDAARGALRFSLGRASTAADVDRALAAVPAAVERLRR
ncbi:MAG: cysteine desulfurase family protein [Acidimicrobiales bacterium]